MGTLEIRYWQDGDWWLGYLKGFPDYLTQGESLDDLRAHLIDLQQEVNDGTLL